MTNPARDEANRAASPGFQFIPRPHTDSFPLRYGRVTVLRHPSRVLALLAAALFGGCSIHPIPDNVSPYSTEEIVRNVRCEAKVAVRERISLALRDYPQLRDIVPDEILQERNYKRIAAVAPKLALTFQNYMGSTIAYDFEFHITERNNKAASAFFKLPFLNGGAVDFGGGAKLEETRDAVRRFKTLEIFADLIKLPCETYAKPGRNYLYPLTGSIGVARIMNTFINLAQLGGGRDTFTDTITFTTRLEGVGQGSLVMEPIKGSVRLVKADAAMSAERADVHKLIVSLSFPTQDLREARPGAPLNLKSIEALGRESTLRAQENLCIARAEEREDRAGTLRQLPPEAYCRRDGNVAR